jgi:hypothetical protein
MSDMAEARQVGRDDVVAIGETRDEIAEHVARARKAMKQQQRRCAFGPGLAIKDLQAVYICGPIFVGSHWSSPGL